MITETPEVKRKRWEWAVKIVICLIAGFIIAPFIFLAIKGLIGLGFAALISVAVVCYAEPVAVSVANWRLKMLKSEAARNPVETLQNDYGRRLAALEKFRDAIKTFSAEVQTFADKLDGFKAQYPDKANRFDEQLGKCRNLLKLRMQKFKEAVASLEAYEQEIKKTGSIWEMGKAAERMSEAAGMTEGDFLAKIMTDTAIDSVQRNINSAFADLEISLVEETEAHAKMLPGIPRTRSVELEVKPLDVAELVRTGR